jgi:uncharacterized protein
MKRTHEPLQLDVAAFAADAGRLEAREAVTAFDRLREQVPTDVPGEEILWSVRGEVLHPQAFEPQIWLRLAARTGVWMTCQRCLQAVRVPVDLERPIRFVRDENTAARMDAESEDDVLALERSLDVRSLIEDEVLLALPIVPRHDNCPVPVPLSSESDDEGDAGDRASHPFAALAALRRRG